MAKIEDWHRRAALQVLLATVPTATESHTWVDGFAKIIASHAPASTAPKEVIERYADEISVLYAYSPLGLEETDRRKIYRRDTAILLTRFAAEIGVDAAGICDWMRSGSSDDGWISDCGKEFELNDHQTPHACGWNACPFCARSLSKKKAAALKAAGGGK